MNKTEIKAFFNLFNYKLSGYEQYSWSGQWGENDLRDTESQKWIAQKMKKARKAGRLLRCIPFVKMVAVCNTLSAGHPKKSSDIDFFIIIEEGRLWIGRLLVTGWMQLWGMRRHGKNVSDHICLSFYITQSAGDLSKVAIENDVYMKFWIGNLLPLWSRDGALQHFFRNNQWAMGEFPQRLEPLPLDQKPTPLPIKIFEIVSFFGVGKILDSLAKKIQKKRIISKDLQRSISTAVVVNDTMLKFHEKDTRVAVRDRWLAKLNQL